MNKKIRLLRADEIDVRAQSFTDKGGIFLLYKDARCDMRILDETFGITGWQRSHQIINGNLFCTVEIWDTEKKQWISKQDVGTESNTEKEKGQASDSFKRACFNIGIGRELYTAPFIFIAPNQGENLKYIKLHVSSIGHNDSGEIIDLEIIDDKGNVRFKFENGKQVYIQQENKTRAPKESKTDYSPSDTILGMIKNATSLANLNEIWAAYPKFQRDQVFKNALTNRKNELGIQSAS